MVATNFALYAEEKDDNQRIGDWAVDKGNSTVCCRLCNDGHPIEIVRMVPHFQILGPSLVPLLSKTGPLFGPSEGLFEGGTRLVITETERDRQSVSYNCTFRGSKNEKATIDVGFLKYS